jgi:hypothetical protein
MESADRQHQRRPRFNESSDEAIRDMGDGLICAPSAQSISGPFSARGLRLASPTPPADIQLLERREGHVIKLSDDCCEMHLPDVASRWPLAQGASTYLPEAPFSSL